METKAMIKKLFTPQAVHHAHRFIDGNTETIFYNNNGEWLIQVVTNDENGNYVSHTDYHSPSEYMNSVTTRVVDNTTLQKIFDAPVNLFWCVEELEQITVHGGIFHLDDICCCALARIAFPGIKIVRSNKPEVVYHDHHIIADVGGVYDPDQWFFDHHMDRYAPDSDPTTVRAAVGRMWDTLGNVKAYPTLTQFIHAVDLHDTGVVWSPLGAAIRSFAPAWNDNFTMDEGFNRALDFVEALIREIIRQDEAATAAEDALDSAPIRDGVLVLDKFMPWQDYVEKRSDIKAVVYPGRDPGSFNCQIPKDRGVFPEDWLTTKPDGITFVPAWRTMACAVNKETAISLVDAIIHQ